MTADRETIFWRSNPEWFFFDEEKDEFVLTDKAPERARRSFDLFRGRIPLRPAYGPPMNSD